MEDLLAPLSQLFTLGFAVSTMLSMGMGLTVDEVVAPLRSWRFVVAALAVNFVVAPALAVALAAGLGLSEDLRIGLILLGCAAGAPMVPKLVQIAKGDAANAVALVTLLIVATVAFLPVALPVLLPGADVDAASIGLSLAGQMLLPLAAGLLVRARWEEEAVEYRPTVTTISNVSLVLLILVSAGQNLPGLVGLLGTGGILAVVVLIGALVVAGWFVAYPARAERRLLALGSGQRNLAAAFVVATANFSDRPDTIIYIAAAGLLMMVILFPLAGELSRRPPASRPGVTVGARQGGADASP